jgi:pimeloyl-ACP methyl ester carboxylesterase
MAYYTLSDGVPLYYKEQGSGRPLILQHALMFGADFFWQKNIPELSKSARVIAVDPRGQGLSGKPNHGFTIKQLAADLNDLVTGLDLRDIVLAGFSLGGFISLQYLQDYGPERVHRLVLMEMTPRLPSAPGWEHPTFGDFPEEAARGYGDALRADRSIYNDFFNAAFIDPPQGEELAAMIANTYLTPTEVAAQLVDEMARQDRRAELADIAVPASLFYAHPHNKILPTRVGQWIQSQIPGSELIEFEQSSHSPFWEEPQKFNRELARIVAES